MISVWYKFRLHTQIATLSAILLAITILVLTFINVKQQQIGLRDDLLKNGLAIGQSLASTLSYNVVSNEYDVIEDVLLKGAEFPEIKSLKIIDKNGLVISHVSKLNPKEIRVVFGSMNDTGPKQLENNQEPVSTFTNKSLVIWYPLKTYDVVGWLNITMSLDELTSRRNNIIFENVVGATIAVLLDFILLLLVFSKQTRKLGRAISVARQLDTTNPPQTNETGESSEISELLSALNSVAKRLKAQYQEIGAQTDKLQNNNISLARAKDELQLSKVRFDRAISGANDGLWDYDVGAAQVWCSSRFNVLLGYAEKDSHMQAREFMDYFNSGENQVLDAFFNSKDHSNTNIDVRCRLQARDKSYIWFRVRGRKYLDADNRLIFIAGSMMDISEQVRIDTMKNEFISTVSHELRTPLTSIHGSLALIASGEIGKMDKAIRSLVDIADRNTERLLQLINDILDVSKIEAGEVQLDYSKLELVDFARKNIELNEGLAKKHKVTLDLVSDIDHGWIYTDEGKLNQIMNNLVSNAIKFSDNEGRVTISLSQFKNYYRLTVADNGPGIEKSYQPFLFDKFTQEQSSLTRKAGGTGLGLAITKQLIELLGGEISYSTVKGKGSKFFVDLPMLKK